MTLYIKEWRFTDDAVDEVRPLPIIPLVAMSVPYFIRQVIMAVRAGTTPVSEYRRFKNESYDQNTLSKLLLALYLPKLSPEFAM